MRNIWNPTTKPPKLLIKNKSDQRSTQTTIDRLLPVGIIDNNACTCPLTWTEKIVSLNDNSETEFTIVYNNRKTTKLIPIIENQYPTTDRKVIIQFEHKVTNSNPTNTTSILEHINKYKRGINSQKQIYIMMTKVT